MPWRLSGSMSPLKAPKLGASKTLSKPATSTRSANSSNRSPSSALVTLSLLLHQH